jgi:DNA-binding NtrC family response regulator
MGNIGNSLVWKILYSEGDAETVTQQSASLQKAGHQVQTAVGRKAVEEALRTGSYDLVILGTTLTKEDRHHLPYMVKKNNIHTKVLVMHTDGERHPCVDVNTDTGRSMADVLNRINAMAPASVASERKMATGAGGKK